MTFNLLAACEREKARLDATPRWRWLRRYRITNRWLYLVSTMEEGIVLGFDVERYEDD